MRILTYNVRAGQGMDLSPALERQAAAIRALAPDVAALQEVDRATRRSGGVDQAAALAGATGLHAVFARSIDFEGGQYGIALLSRERPGSVRVVPLPSPHDEDRALLVADFGAFVFAVTHLSLHDGDRAESVDRILAELLPSPKPVFLAGDWNALPDDLTLRRIGRGFAVLTDPSVPTFPAAAPDRCIDYVAVDRDHADAFRGAVSRVVDEPSASDHRPVLLDLPGVTINLPIAPKDVFRILALRCIVESEKMLKVLFENWNSIYHGITTTERLYIKKRKPFGYEHNGLSDDKESCLKGKSFAEFTERQLCASTRAFFGKGGTPIGQVIDYELPLDCSSRSAYGKIDLVSVDWKNNNLFLLEVKKVDSDEHPLRAMFEIFTFWKMLMDEKGGFDTFLKAYKQSKQFKTTDRSVDAKMNVVPGLLLCKKSAIYKSLISDKMTPTEKKLYGRFLSDKIGLRVFSYSEEDLSVQNITDTVKRNCGMV